MSPTVEQVLGWVRGLPGPVAVVYEAGPTGFGLARALNAAGVRCEVAAPSKLIRPPGDRVKTDARDAVHLARLLHLDQVTSVAVPTVGQEAARDLVRAREDCRGDLMRARHRLSKMLLRHQILYVGGRAWTEKHEFWLRRQVRPQLADSAAVEPSQRATLMAFDACFDTVLDTTARRARLDTAIEQVAADSEFAAVVARLGCLRGVSTLTAFALAVEIGDWGRFTGSSIGSFVGLVPSEHSSGASRSQGPITKAGNSHARRLLVEAAWHHQRPYRPGRAMQQRWARSTPAARARGDLGNRRLAHRWARFTARDKRPTVANTAIARELAGWCWSLATLED